MSGERRQDQARTVGDLRVETPADVVRTRTVALQALEYEFEQFKIEAYRSLSLLYRLKAAVNVRR